MPIIHKEIILILHNIRSAENVGSIFRTSDAAGVFKIYCAGYTPAPVDKFGRKQNKIKKTALGAEETVLWEKVKDIGSIIKKLKKEGFFIAAIEQNKKAIDYRFINGNNSSTSKIAFVFGNEKKGISGAILNKCDEIREIPMRGKKESLNVSVAVGIVLFSLD